MLGWLFYPGWGWSYQASQDASEAKTSAHSAEMTARSMQSSVRNLEQHVDRLTLAVMALAELMRDRGVTEAEIEAKVREIDLRDGQLDGRVTQTLKNCPSCGRVNAPRREICLYCGAKLLGDSPLV